MDNKEEKEIEKEIDIKKKKRKNKKQGMYIVWLIFTVMIIGAFIIALNNIGLLKIKGIKTNKAELNYTQTTDKIKEGILFESHPSQLYLP